MATTMVTVGQPETPGRQPREPRSRGSILAAVGLGAGLALGALFTGGGPSEEPTADTVVSEPDASPTTTIVSTTTTDVPEPRLATLVPGMLDVLVASGVDLNGTPTVTLWQPADRQPARSQLPWGDFEPDSSRAWLALATPSRWVAGSTLWVGNSAYLEPVTADLISGPVWHSRRPGNLAWVEDAGDGPMLTVAEFIPGRAAIPRHLVALEEGTVVIGWWDTGLVTQTVESLQLRDTDGTVLRQVGGVHSVTGLGRDVVTFVDPEGLEGAFDAQLAPLRPPGWSTDCWRVEWSLGGAAAGVLCGSGPDLRFEYWTDPFNTPEPLFVESGHEFTDLGFTTNGLPYAVWIDPIRITSTIVFFHPADGSVRFIDHPGRIQHLTSVAS